MADGSNSGSPNGDAGPQGGFDPLKRFQCQQHTLIWLIPASSQRPRPVCRSGRGPKLRPTSECTHDLSLLPSLRPWFLVLRSDYSEVGAGIGRYQNYGCCGQKQRNLNRLSHDLDVLNRFAASFFKGA